MQLKESVHKWWEDKKTKMAGAAMSIIQWLLKAAALGALWLLFDWLSKQDIKKMYEDIKASWEKFTTGMGVMWTLITRLGAWLGVEKLIMFMKGGGKIGPLTRMVNYLKTFFLPWRI